MEKAIWIVVTVAVALIIGVIIVTSTNITMKQLTAGASHKIKNTVGGLGEERSINGENSIVEEESDNIWTKIYPKEKDVGGIIGKGLYNLYSEQQ